MRTQHAEAVRMASPRQRANSETTVKFRDFDVIYRGKGHLNSRIARFLSRSQGRVTGTSLKDKPGSGVLLWCVGREELWHSVPCLRIVFFAFSYLESV
jgi:hypothetical protein